MDQRHKCCCDADECCSCCGAYYWGGEKPPYAFNYRFVIFATIYYALFVAFTAEPHWFLRVFSFLVFICLFEGCGILYSWLKQKLFSTRK